MNRSVLLQTLPASWRFKAVLLAVLGVGFGQATGSLACDSRKSNDKDDPFTPLVKVQHEDYAQARSRFRTRLSREAASPQKQARVDPPTGVAEVEYVSAKLRLKAWLQPPADQVQKHPAVLFLHGGFACDIADWGVSQAYRDAGFVVMTPILRGENGQPGCFSFYYNEVDDVLAAAERLSKLPYVDAHRLYIAGPSAGGTLALLAAMTSNRFQAAASFSGITDQVVFCKHARDAKRDIPIDIANLRELEMRSPLAYATSFKCPVQMYYGSLEPHLRPMTERTAKLARDSGLDVEAAQVDGDHSTSVTPAIKRSIAFFQRK